MNSKTENNNKDNNKNLLGEDPENTNMLKDPDDWKTGDEPMTGAQKSYLKTLCDQAKEEFNDDLTKAEAAKKIEELQKKTGRGV